MNIEFHFTSISMYFTLPIRWRLRSKAKINPVLYISWLSCAKTISDCWSDSLPNSNCFMFVNCLDRSSWAWKWLQKWSQLFWHWKVMIWKTFKVLSAYLRVWAASYDAANSYKGNPKSKVFQNWQRSGYGKTSLQYNHINTIL